MKRSGLGFLVIIFLSLLGAPHASNAQQPGKVYHVGWLHPVPLPPEWMEGFRQGLREFGYREGENLVIESRWDVGFDQLSAMATDLVQLKVDLLLAGNTAALRALKQATRTIPIVMLGTADPVATGLVTNLARPGGNITGLSGMYPQLSGKRLELLKEVVPKLARVMMLSNPRNPSVILAVQETQVAAKTLGLTLDTLDVRQASDLGPVLSTVARRRPDALVLPAETTIHEERDRIAAFAIQHRLPSISAWREFAEAGGLMVYGNNIPDIFRRAVGYMDRILKGANPGTLPIEQPTKFELIINLKTAKALGLTIPQAVLARADELIQ
jgi:putative ABC transport system substrate-binding protein